MLDSKTAKKSPLQRLQPVCFKNGPPLPVGWELCRCQKPQVLLAVPFLQHCGPFADLPVYFVRKYFRHWYERLGLDLDYYWLPEYICRVALCVLRVFDLEALDDNRHGVLV